MVSFGTTVASGRLAIDTLFKVIEAECPDREIRIAYTSNIIRRKLNKSEGGTIDSPQIALAKMRDQGFSHVTVVSTHIIPGKEYGDLQELIRGTDAVTGKYGFSRLVLLEPFLYRQDDFERFVRGLQESYGESGDAHRAVVLMGHGSYHFANAAYSQLQIMLDREDDRFVIGTVEGMPTLDDVRRRLRSMKVTRVTLAPCMVVAGDHAMNDMAGFDDDSWATILRRDGYDVNPVLTGLGELPWMGEMLAQKFRFVDDEV